MAHVLCITTGLTGILHASFEVARRLGAAGHRVTCLSWSPVGEAVKAQGLPFVPLPPFVASPAPPFEPRNGAGRLGRLAGRWATRRSRLGAGAAALRPDTWVRTLGGLDADLALVDAEVHEAVLAAHALGLPTVLLSPWFSLWPGTGQPPLSSSTVPGEAAGAGAVCREWARLSAARWRRRLRHRLGGHVDRSDVLRRRAREVGFPTREWVRTSFPPPFVYRSLPVLSMTLEEMEFPQRRRPGLHYVGPMVDADRKDVRARPDTEAAVEAAIARSREAGARLVYGAASSMDAGDLDVLRRLVAVFSRRTDWHLVLGLGGTTDAGDLGPLPPNVTALAWTPQLRLLAAADVAVTHAGINTIHECLHFGVPMLVYSGGRYDQDGCAARVEHHGLGVRGDKARDDAAAIERRLERVLSDRSFRDAVERFQALADRHRSQNTVAEVVGRYLDA